MIETEENSVIQRGESDVNPSQCYSNESVEHESLASEAAVEEIVRKARKGGKNSQKISFAGRSLIVLPYRSLLECPNVRSLSLEKTSLAVLKGSHLQHLADNNWNQTLKKLYLQENHLTSLPRQISLFIHLTELNVSKNQLRFFPEGICSLSNLVKLNVSENSIPELPPSIARLTNLQILRASNNMLAAIPWELSELRRIREVSFENNPIISPPSDLWSMGMLAVMRYLRCPQTYEEFIAERLETLEYSLYKVEDHNFEGAESIKNRLYVPNPKYDRKAEFLFSPKNFRSFCGVPLGRLYFTRYLRKHNCLEVFECSHRLEHLLLKPPTDVEHWVRGVRPIYNRYLCSFAPNQVYLPSALRFSLQCELEASPLKESRLVGALHRCYRYICQVLNRDHFANFIYSSTEYEWCLIQFCKSHCGKAGAQVEDDLDEGTQFMELNQLLSSPDHRNAFAEFLKSEYSLENLLFWEVIAKYKQKCNSYKASTRLKKAQIIYDTFLSGNGQYSITVPGEEHARLRRLFEKNASGNDQEKGPKDFRGSSEMFGGVGSSGGGSSSHIERKGDRRGKNRRHPRRAFHAEDSSDQFDMKKRRGKRSQSARSVSVDAALLDGDPDISADLGKGRTSSGGNAVDTQKTSSSSVSPNLDEIDACVFDTSLKVVEQLLTLDSLPRYLCSDAFQAIRERKKSSTKKSSKKKLPLFKL